MGGDGDVRWGDVRWGVPLTAILDLYLYLYFEEY